MENKVPDYAVHDDEKISGFFGPYRFLSNFWPVQLKFEGDVYPSVEHAFQAAKTLDTNLRKQIAAMATGKAKGAGRTIVRRKNWEDIKVDVMFYLVCQKFTTDWRLREKLKDTGTRRLVEANNWGDAIWGVPYIQTEDLIFGNTIWSERIGENNLGKILERVRNIIT